MMCKYVQFLNSEYHFRYRPINTQSRIRLRAITPQHTKLQFLERLVRRRGLL